MSRTCKYLDNCEWADKDSPVCMEKGGSYYDSNRPAGCFRYNESLEVKG